MQDSITGKKKAFSTGCLALFFSIFFIVGAGTFYILFLKPFLHILAAKTWKATPCTIQSSELVTHSGDDSNTYSIKIVYSYRFNGTYYTSNRYDFSTGSSSEYEWKKKVVEQLPPGTESICYVNPDKPLQAVLDREFHNRLLLNLLFTLPFLLAGAGGLIAIPWLRKSMNPKSVTDWKPESGIKDSPGFGPVQIKTKETPLKKFLSILFISIFWNGLVSIFVFFAVRTWKGGHPEWILIIILIPFVLVGLLLIYGVFYQFLALFNPRCTMTISKQKLTLGESIDVQWEIRGRLHIIQRLEIYLEGEEEATYRRGTSTYTDRNTFAKIQMIDTPTIIRSGTCSVRIPEDTMHSFDAPNNTIIWTIHLKGNIKGWPDLLEQFPIVISPYPLERIAGGFV